MRGLFANKLRRLKMEKLIHYIKTRIEECDKVIIRMEDEKKCYNEMLEEIRQFKLKILENR